MSIETFSTGSMLLDLAVGGGWPKGSLVNIQGDTSSGKTLLILEAAANILLKWPNARVALTEREPSFNMEYVSNLGIPVEKIEFWNEIYTIEDWYTQALEFKNSLEDNQPGLLLLDSLDALSDEAEMERDINAGTFGANKPRKISEVMRRLAGEFEEKGITTMIISQLRDALNSPVPMKKASGGHAVPFYSGVIVRLSEKKPGGKIERMVNGIKRPVGLNVHAKCLKNKVGLPYRECDLKLLFGYGIDDTASNLEWLKTIKGGLEQVPAIGTFSFASDSSEEKPKKAKKKDEEGESGKSPAIYLRKLMELPPEEIKVKQQEIADLTRRCWLEIEQELAPKMKKY